jgi:hypothetical protein
MSRKYFIQHPHNIHSSQPPHETFSKTDHVLGHKARFSKNIKIEIIPYILADYNALKLELNNKNNSRKISNNGG